MRAGAGPQFQGPYLRRPLEEWAPKYKGNSAGPFVGIGYANVDGFIARLCTRGDGEFDWQLYRGLHVDIDLDTAYDLAEIREVARSWHDATLANGKFTRKADR